MDLQTPPRPPVPTPNQYIDHSVTQSSETSTPETPLSQTHAAPTITTGKAPAKPGAKKPPGKNTAKMPPLTEQQIVARANNLTNALLNVAAEVVLVMAAAPHYCLFVGANRIGSVHDYDAFKDNCNNYTDYLKKRTSSGSSQPNPIPNIQTQQGSDETTTAENSYWSILADSSYIGQDPTPYPVLTIGKSSTIVEDVPDEVRKLDPEKKVLWVNVECFFGRMYKLWNILSKTFKLGRDSFDDYFDLCALLTNEHIEMMISNSDIDYPDIDYQRNTREEEPTCLTNLQIHPRDFEYQEFNETWYNEEEDETWYNGEEEEVDEGE
eukprot:gene1553-1966_t